MATFMTARIPEGQPITSADARVVKLSLVHPGTGNRTWVVIFDTKADGIIVRGAPWTFPFLKEAVRNGFPSIVDDLMGLQDRVNDWWVNQPPTKNIRVE